MKKTVIGLNLKFLPAAVIASVIGALDLLLPYVYTDSDKGSAISYLGQMIRTGSLSGLSWLLVLLVVFSILAAVFAVWNFLRPSVAGVRTWMLCLIVRTAVYTVLLFANKAMLDSAGVLAEAFLVKDLGPGFWIGLICTYAALYLTMRTAKVNAGYIVLTILAILWMFPILWIILTSFRGEGGYYVGYFIPKTFTLENYTALFAEDSVFPFGKWWLNTLFVAVCTCIPSTLIILGTSYTLSRVRFSGRRKLMQIMLIIGMFPGFMSMIAIYNILKGIGLAQTLTALIVVSVAGSAMGYYVCKGFFDTISHSLDEAAIIDGATRWQIFTRILIPLSKPIIVYTVLSSFLGAWSDYIFPSMVLGDQKNLYTVAIGLYSMTTTQNIETYYTQFAAGSIMVAVPIVILFVWLQRYYVEGLSGAVKG